MRTCGAIIVVNQTKTMTTSGVKNLLLRNVLPLGPTVLIGALTILPYAFRNNNCQHTSSLQVQVFTAATLENSTTSVAAQSTIASLQNFWETRQQTLVPQIHAVNAILVSLITKRLLNNQTTALPVLLAGLLLSICPITTDVIGDHIVPATLLFLLGLLFLLKGIESKKTTQYALYVLLSAASITLHHGFYALQVVTLLATISETISTNNSSNNNKAPSTQFLAILSLLAGLLGMIFRLATSKSLSTGFTLLMDITRYLELSADASISSILDGFLMWKSIPWTAHPSVVADHLSRQLIDRNASFDVFVFTALGSIALGHSTWKVVRKQQISGLAFVYLAILLVAIGFNQPHHYLQTGHLENYYMTVIVGAIATGTTIHYTFIYWLIHRPSVYTIAILIIRYWFR